LYTSLSEAGNPTLTNLNSILKAVGLKIAVVPDSEESCVQETPPELAVADQLHIDSNARKAIEGLTKAANINVAIPNVMGFFGVEPHPGLGYFNFKLQAGLGAYTREPLTMKATWSVFGNAVEKEIQNQSGVTDSCKTALAQMETFTGKVTRPAGISVQQPTL
jgi:hypothetical protein